MVKVAINGFGRIGRPVFRRILKKHPDLEVVAINDLTSPQTLAYLLKYDSLYGVYEKTIKSNANYILIDGTTRGRKVKVLAESNPGNLPWEDMGVDVVLECTGRYRDFEGAQLHMKAGAKAVIISAPSDDPEKVRSFVLGVNEEDFDPEKDKISDMGSCTTNCLLPVVKVLNENFKIIEGFMTTIHSYTNDQRILDLPHEDPRRARAAALNIIPTSTGASKAVGKIFPDLKGRIKGMAFRCPTPVVSVLDLVCRVKKSATAEEVNYVFKKASQAKELEGILGVEDAPLVSSDFKRNSFSAIIDSPLTKTVGDLIKIVAWYDNEWAYACRLAEFAEYVGKRV